MTRPLRAHRTPSRPAHARTTGFTLLDMLIALVILGVVLGIAIPCLNNAVARIRAVGARSAISLTLFDAQRQATLLGQEVVICPGDAGRCSGGTDWSSGWLAFVDADGDRQHGPGEAVVRQEPALPGGVHLDGSIGRQRLVYQPNGSVAGSNITFTLCDRRGAAAAQRLILANGGRLRHDRAPATAAQACVNRL